MSEQPLKNTEQIQSVAQDTGKITESSTVSIENSPSKVRFNLREEGDSSSVVKQLTERFVPIYSGNWDMNDKPGNLMFNKSFPATFFNSCKNLSYPNTAYLEQYTYWNADFEFEIEITSPKTMYGILGTSWCYDFSRMILREREMRSSFPAILNMDHHLLHAESATKISFVVPYKNIKPYGLVDKSNNGYPDAWNMFNLFVFPVINLQTSTGPGNLRIGYQIRCRMLNLRVSGIRAKPQSGVISLVQLGERLLDMYNRDENRDNPSDIREPRNVIIRNSQQMSSGKGLRSVTIPLRLDPTKTTPFTQLVEDEMKVSFITRKYGFVTSFQWRATDVVDNKTPLVVIPITPMFVSNYSVDPKRKVATLITLPPVGVISSLFSYWRGSLEYRFSLSTTLFVSGKVVVAFIPRNGPRSRNFATGAGFGSYHTIYEVGAGVEFVFKVPFISDKNFVRVCNEDYSLNDSSIGDLVVLPWTNLITQQNSSNPRIIFNVCMRGGDDFELAVPTQPSLGLGINRIISKDKSFITAKTGYDPFYFDVWRKFGDSVYLINRYGPGSDHISQYNDVIPGVVYRVTNVDQNLTVKVAKGDNVIDVVVKFFACFTFNDGYDNYLAPIPEENVDKFLIDQNVSYFFKSLYGYSYKYFEILPLGLVFHMGPRAISAQSGELIALGCEKKMLSYDHFGEIFDDLKDIFRRFNVYGDSYTTIKKETPIGMVLFKIPVKCQPLRLGISDGNSLTEYRRIAREGPIGVASSCFRYMRGSLRFKLIFKSIDVTVAVFHDPTDYTVTNSIEIPRGVNINNFIIQGCAGVVQNLKTNNVIDIEVPFYKETDFICNGTYRNENGTWTKNFQNFCIGSLKVVLMDAVNTDTALSINCYFALGDDARFHTYIGYYPMISINEISYPQHFKAQAQIGCVSSKQKTSSKQQLCEKESEYKWGISIPHLLKINRSIKYKTLKDKTPKEQPQMGMIDKIVGVSKMEMRETVLNTSNCVNRVNSFIDTIEKEQLLEKVTNMLNSVLENFSGSGILGDVSISLMKEKMINLSTALVHVMINPKLPTVCVSLTQVIVALGLLPALCCQGLAKIFSKLYNLISKLFNMVPSQCNQEPIASPQSDGGLQYEEICACISSITAILVNSFGSVNKMVKAPRYYLFNELSKDLKNTANTSNALFVFFRNSLSMFIKLYTIVKTKLLKPEDSALELLGSESNRIYKWYSESNKLLDPLNRESVRNSPKNIILVFICKTIGDKYVETLLSVSKPEMHIVSLVRSMTSKLTEFCNELTNECLAPQVRFEPFVFQLFGESKAGKSFAARKIILNLLKDMGIKTMDPIFTRNPGPAYLNGIGCQPCFYVDDFLQMLDTSYASEAIAELFCLKSPSIFNPNIAQLDRKNLRYNPLMVTLCSNQGYYGDLNLPVLDMQALHRRRDALWSVRVCDIFRDPETKLFDPKRCDQAQLDRFDHLVFIKHYDPTNPKSSTSREYTFNEFYADLLKDFKEYYNREMTNYRKRLQEVHSLMPDFSDDMEINDMYSEFDNYIRTFNSDLFAESTSDINLDEETRLRMHHLRNRMVAQQFKTKQPLSHFTTGEIMETFATAQSGETIVKLKPYPPFTQDGPLRIRLKDELSKDMELPTFQLEEEHLEGRYEACVHVNALSCGGEYHVYYNKKSKQLLQYTLEEGHVVTMDSCAGRFGESLCLLDLPKARESLMYRLRLKLVDDLPYQNRVNIADPASKEIVIAKLRYLGYDVPPTLHCENKLIKRMRDLADQNLQYLRDNTRFINRWIMRMKDLGLYFLKITGKVVLIGLAVYTGLTIVDKMTGASKTVDFTAHSAYEPAQGQSRGGAYNSGYSNSNRSPAKQFDALAMRKFLPKPEFASEEVGFNIVRRNLYMIKYINMHDKMSRSNIFGIANRRALITGHMLEEILYIVEKRGSLMLHISQNERNITIPFEDCKYEYDYNTSSLACIIFPKSIPMFKNILSHIATAKEHVNTCVDDCRLLHRKEQEFEVTNIRVETYSDIVVSETDFSKGFVLPACYAYDKGGYGYCGSVLIRLTPSFKIMGIHVAGHNNIRGYSEPICTERFSDWNIQPIAESQSSCEDKQLIKLEGAFIELGTVDRKEQLRQNPKTAYKKTDMYGCFGVCNKQPAILTKNDPRAKDFIYNPLTYGVQKHGNPPLPFPEDIVQQATRDLGEMLIATSPPIYSGSNYLLDDQTIFGGKCGVNELKGLDLHTSEGYPLQLQRPPNRRNKAWLFDYNQTEEGNILNKIDPILGEVLNEQHNIRVSGGINQNIFTDVLKDELVGKHKLIPGGTRVFSVSPIQYTWVIKKYFGLFQASYMRNRIRNETAIGINPQGSEWAELLRYLKEVNNDKKSDSFITGDYKAFGDGLSFQCIRAAFQAIFMWYDHYYVVSDEDKLIREILVEELLNATHLAQNTLYKQYCGIPSGFAMTVEINSLVNCLYMRIVFMLSTMRLLSDFGRYVKLITYGDDLLMKVSSKIINEFNFVVIRDTLKEFGIEFTPATKIQDENRKTFPLSEVNFLKRQFNPHPTRRNELLATLPESSILEMLNWYKPILSKPRLDCMLENARAALNNAFASGPEYYEYLRNRLIAWFAQHYKMQFRSPTWKEMDLSIF